MNKAWHHFGVAGFPNGTKALQYNESLGLYNGLFESVSEINYKIAEIMAKDYNIQL